MDDALENVLDSMSPAEAFNFGSALNQIGKSAGRLVSDPTFVPVVRTAVPIAGGAVGTLIGGPVGTALGSQLGNLAASALPARPAPPPADGPRRPAAAASSPGIPAPAAQPVVAAPVPSAAAVAPPGVPPHRAAASPVAGGSAAAAQGLVLTQQPDVLRSLLATALGQHGRQTGQRCSCRTGAGAAQPGLRAGGRRRR